jgi:hypothetical protein
MSGSVFGFTPRKRHVNIMPVYLEHAERQSDKIEPETAFQGSAKNIRRESEHLNVKILYRGHRHQAVADTPANQKSASARIANDPRNLDYRLIHHLQSR